MPESKYFFSLAGAVVLGIIVLIVAGVIAFLSLPYIITALPFLFVGLAGIMALIVGILVVWAILYVLAWIGIFVIYLFKPMKVSKEDKGYSVKKVKESGTREKGDSKK